MNTGGSRRRERGGEPGALEPLSGVLDAVIAGLGGDAGGLVRIREAWAEIAGEHWSTRTRPVAVTDGTLVVEVPDGATASLARYETGRFVSGVRAIVPGAAVQAVRVRVARQSRTPET